MLDDFFLFIVDSSFMVTGRGLILAPALKVPDKFKNFSDSLTIIRPDGTKLRAEASFCLEHLLKSATKNIGAYIVTVTLKDITAADVPNGSRIYGSEVVEKKFGCKPSVEPLSR